MRNYERETGTKIGGCVDVWTISNMHAVRLGIKMENYESLLELPLRLLVDIC